MPPWRPVIQRGILAGLVAVSLPVAAQAQRITIDGSLSPAQTLIGPNYAIGANLGKQVGGNLFHSFGKFGLSAGESANFTGPATVNNIIGRVTGGQQSSINGQINSSIADANLYLINPAGIVFGPQAAINISGSFRASTADYLKLSDSTKIMATTTNGSEFTTAAPAAFGFLNAPMGTIAVNGANLAVPSGQTLGLSGGSITVNGGSLKAPSGSLFLTGVASAGEIPVAGSGASATITTHGDVTIKSGALLQVGDRVNKGPAGILAIHAGNLILDDSTLDADNYSATGGGSVLLSADGQINVRNGSEVLAGARSSGRGADITIHSSGLSVTGISEIATYTLGAGRAGDIAITADTVQVTESSDIGSFSLGLGNAGNINIDVKGTLTVADGIFPVFTAIESVAFDRGDAGAITINAGALVILNGGQIASITSASGNSGSITINAGSLTLGPVGQISTETQGPGNAGSVVVNVIGALTIDGDTRVVGSGIGSQAYDGDTGNAGTVTVNAGSLTLLNGGLISTSTKGPHDAGNVTVNVVGALTIDGGPRGVPSHIDSSAVSPGTANAGTVTVNAGSLTVVNRGRIETATDGPGDAGTVTVRAGSLTVASGARIDSATSGAGAGGNVNIVAGDVVLSGGGPQVSAQSTSSGDAGSITITANNLTLNSGASISSGATSADGGNIILKVGRLLYLDHSGILTSVGTGKGNGGNILIDPQFVVLNSGAITANAFGGNGGNITIEAGQFIQTADSIIQASSELGISGTVAILGPQINVASGLVPLSGDLRNAVAVSRDTCTGRSSRSPSSLVLSGHGGVIRNPSETLPATFLAGRDVLGSTGIIPPFSMKSEGLGPLPDIAAPCH